MEPYDFIKWTFFYNFIQIPYILVSLLILFVDANNIIILLKSFPYKHKKYLHSFSGSKFKCNVAQANINNGVSMRFKARAS